MRTELKYFVCEHCRNVVELVHDAGVPIICCGEKMVEMKANTADAAQEKHLPVFEVKENEVIVTISSIAHPMEEAHHIAWVSLVTEQGTQRKELDPTGSVTVKFPLLPGDKVVSVYAYCNLHGLWRTEAK